MAREDRRRLSRVVMRNARAKWSGILLGYSEVAKCEGTVVKSGAEAQYCIVAKSTATAMKRKVWFREVA